jgi:hypothetical protein
MRRASLLLSLLAACADQPEAGERLGVAEQPFASAGSVLVDLEFDAKLTADTMDPPKVRQLIASQLMYLVGQLNGEQSVGRQDRAEFSVTTFGSAPNAPGNYAFTYHAKIPVAWGGGQPPATYTVTLPVRAGDADQITFAEKYATACTDPEGGVMGGSDAGRMFLFYRPQRAGCVLSPDDVVTATARLAKSAENTVGKYPEYHRVWEDDSLDVVSIFGMEFDDGRAEDGGTQAFEAFAQSAETYVRSVQVDPSVSPKQPSDEGALRSVRLAGELPSGRKIGVDAILVPAHLSEQRTSFDDWYDARSVNADLIIYSGHAGLGSNARTLAQKGAFRAKKYVVMTFNGCDTFAYLDRSLADRRAVLNPDDPGGTKYMDTVSNVLGGYFQSGDETSLSLMRAFVPALGGAPKTYAEIFAGIDPRQIVVVTGEEDNQFQPGMLTATSVGSDAGAPPPPPSPSSQDRADARSSSSSGSCSAATNGGTSSRLDLVAVVIAAAAVKRRRRR